MRRASRCRRFSGVSGFEFCERVLPPARCQPLKCRHRSERGARSASLFNSMPLARDICISSENEDGENSTTVSCTIESAPATADAAIIVEEEWTARQLSMHRT